MSAANGPGPMEGNKGSLTHLGTQHAENFAALVAHNRLLDLVVEHRNSEAALIVGLGLKVDVPKMSKLFVALDGVGDDILAIDIAFIGRDKAPT